MLKYFNQNKPLVDAIDKARQHPGDFDDLFETLKNSRIWFVLTGDAQDRESYEYLDYGERGTFVAAYTSEWHARKSKQQSYTARMEIDFPLVFDLTCGEIGLALNPHSSSNLVLHPAALRDMMGSDDTCRT